MADITIEGCVNRETGVIIFVGEACDEGDYTGCIVRVGHPDYALHPDTVAVEVVEVDCDDTYYGCIDRSTGKFKVKIPDDCCIPPSLCKTLNCECSRTIEDPAGEDGCFYPDKVPNIICVEFEGVRKCSDSSLWEDVNQAFCASYQSPYFWSAEITIDGASHNLYVEYFDGGNLQISRFVGGTDMIIFRGGPRWEECTENTANLELEDCGYYMGVEYIGYDGTAKLYNPCTKSWP